MRLEGLSVRWETTILPLKGGKNKATKKTTKYLNEAQAIKENSKEDCSSEEEHKENALASGADEGRD